MTPARTRQQAPQTRALERWVLRLRLLIVLGAAGAAGCAPVRPEQRAILADKIMQFGADARARAALEHALENREGSSGGGAVEGGGCGCN
jgi:hypothetical protein